MNRALLRRAVAALDCEAHLLAGLSQAPGAFDAEDTPQYADARKLERQLQPHRHDRSSWLIAGGYVEWCYQCGAWRQLVREHPGNVLRPAGPWNKPSGIGGSNPAMKEGNVHSKAT